MTGALRSPFNRHLASFSHQNIRGLLRAQFRHQLDRRKKFKNASDPKFDEPYGIADLDIIFEFNLARCIDTDRLEGFASEIIRSYTTLLQAGNDVSFVHPAGRFDVDCTASDHIVDCVNQLE